MSQAELPFLEKMTSLLLEGQLDGDEQQNLLALLEHDADARANYRELLRLHVLLGAQCAPPPELSAPSPKRLAQFWRFTYEQISQSAALAVIISGLVNTIILLSLGLWMLPDRNPAVDVGEVPSLEFVAHIERTFEATFDKSSGGNFKNRSLFADDKVVLNSGIVVIEYDTGARIMLEGPVTFQIDGHNGGFLAKGKLVARVDTEQAHGFAVVTPAATIEDLGTEFAVEVRDDNAVTAGVLEGKIRISTGKVQRELVGGQTVSVTQAGEIAHITSDLNDIRKRFALGWLSDESGLSKFRSAELNQATLGYWPLDGDIRNRVGPAADGRIEGDVALSLGGKFGGALRFTGGTGRVAVDPAQLQLGKGDLAIALWFKREANQVTNRRILSLGAISDEDPGYTIMASDEGLKAIVGDGNSRRIDAFARHAGPGVWQHLVLNIDRDGEMAIYLDGRPSASANVKSIAGSDIQSNVALWIGGAEVKRLGWTGMIDEVSIFRRTLTEVEISNLAVPLSGAVQVREGGP